MGRAPDKVVCVRVGEQHKYHRISFSDQFFCEWFQSLNLRPARTSKTGDEEGDHDLVGKGVQPVGLPKHGTQRLNVLELPRG